MLASSESQSFLLKKHLKTKKKSEVMCQYPIIICISQYNKIAGFWQKKYSFQHISWGVSRNLYTFWILFST